MILQYTWCALPVLQAQTNSRLIHRGSIHPRTYLTMAVFPCCPLSTGSLYVLKFSFRNAQEPDGNCVIVTGRSECPVPAWVFWELSVQLMMLFWWQSRSLHVGFQFQLQPSQMGVCIRAFVHRHKSLHCTFFILMHRDHLKHQQIKTNPLVHWWASVKHIVPATLKKLAQVAYVNPDVVMWAPSTVYHDF